jgi:predicted  nucleic acid-binding Zn-ribbon protein
MSTQRRACPVLTRFAVSLFSASLVLVAGTMPSHTSAKAGPRNAEDLLIVDCLLPGQIRKLGRQATFMSARRPIRTSQADCEIRGGEYTSYDRANYQTALKVWMDQATAGSAEAQNYVGEIYLKGLGIAPDYDMAAVWLKKSAEQGFKRAKINLGYLYEQGLGVPKDLSQALNLYRDASGITNDDIVFASTVQVQMEAKEAEISGLKQTVQQQREESEALREQVKRLQGQLDNRRAALEQSERELENTRLRLNQARAATGVDISSLDRRRNDLTARSAELDRQAASLREQQEESNRQARDAEQRLAELKTREAALNAQADPAAETRQALADIRTQTTDLAKALADAQARAAEVQKQLSSNQSLLEKEREAYQAEIAKLEQQAAGRKQEDWQLMKLLENQLAAQESEIRQQREQISSLQRRVASGSGAGGGAIAAAVPTLELIDPPLTATRGRPAAMLQRAPGRQDLVGKISAPQGVQSIRVNGAPAAIGANGVFRSSVDVAAGGTMVQIAAVDTRGTEAQLEFMMIPQGEGTKASVAQAAPKAGSVPSGVKLGSYHALVIGNNVYQSSAGYPALQSAVNDATAVAQLLRSRYGYKTQLLLNATRFDILSALNEMRETLKAEDNLLVYYAGHGEIGADGKQGYWIPVDGQPGVPGTWISNGAISEILDTMQARKVLVVADSCYSGAMTRASVATFDSGVMPADQWADWVRTMASGRSRTALTSGGVQPVPDTGSGKHSYFARAFLNVLQDNNRLLEAQRLFREVSSSLALAAVNSPVTQVPEYSPIQFAGHEAGDFFFAPKGTAATGP